MTRHAWIALALLLASAPASAGRLYGTLQVGGRAMAPDRPIYVHCPPPREEQELGQGEPTGVVGRRGRYNLKAPAEGDCVFAVRLRDGRLVHVPIISFDTPTRYDFVINRRGDQLFMERKH